MFTGELRDLDPQLLICQIGNGESANCGPKCVTLESLPVDFMKQRISGESLPARLSLTHLYGNMPDRGLELELRRHAPTFQFNVMPCGLVVHPDAPHLCASPDGKWVDPTENPPFGLVKVKCPDMKSIAEATHIRLNWRESTVKENTQILYTGARPVSCDWLCLVWLHHTHNEWFHSGKDLERQCIYCHNEGYIRSFFTVTCAWTHTLSGD